MPAGVRRIAGPPALLVAASYEASPVGPYRELAVAVPARVGMRPGWCVVLSVVDCAAARSAYRERWALPAELGKLRWSTSPSTSSLACSWLDGGLEVRASVVGRARVPLVMPARSLQRRHDGPVVLPRWLWGVARPARVDVEVGLGSLPAWMDDPSRSWAWLAGPHAGLVVSSLRLAAAPARQPAGFLSSLRAPHAPSAEPALSAADRR
jgi:hypothetical protein